MNQLLGIIIAAFLGALLSGVLGYAVAIIKRDTAIALLQREHKFVVDRLDKIDQTNVEQTERIDRHLRVIFRLILDIARKSGVDVRTADAVEIASLSEGDINVLDNDPDAKRRR